MVRDNWKKEALIIVKKVDVKSYNPHFRKHNAKTMHASFMHCLRNYIFFGFSMLDLVSQSVPNLGLCDNSCWRADRDFNCCCVEVINHCFPCTTLFTNCAVPKQGQDTSWHDPYTPLLAHHLHITV